MPEFRVDRVYLSVDRFLDGTDFFLAERQNVSFLNDGESYASQVTAAIPGVSAGTYFLLVKAERARCRRRGGFFAENDNVGVGPQIQVTQPPPPDLVVTNVQMPELAFSGQPMSITYTVEKSAKALSTSFNGLTKS